MKHPPLFERLLPTLPDGRVQDILVGMYWTAVVVETEGELRCGLAATVGDESHHYSNRAAVPRAGFLHERSARQLADLALSESITEVSIGVAAVNALLPRRPADWTDIHAEEVIVRYGAQKRVVMVGHFPFVPRLRPRVGLLQVLEQHPREDDLPASAAPEVIPQADVLAMTSMTLLNGTFDALMRLPRPETVTLLLGPTTPLTPLLFEYGVDIVSGAIVEDIPLTLRAIAQGANFHQLHHLGVRLVSMQRERAIR